MILGTLRVDLELPDDWEEGYLRLTGEGVEFVYGQLDQ